MRVPEVTDVTTYVGLSSPVDFSGLIRHYYLRQGGHVADVRFNLAGKKLRAQQSHAMALRLRPDLEAIAQRYGAAIQILEMPPGPPVIATLTAEVYAKEGQSYDQMVEAAARVRHLMEQTPGVVDIDDISVAPQTQGRLRGGSGQGRPPRDLRRTDRQPCSERPGRVPRSAACARDEEVNPLRIVLQLPREQRSRTAQLEQFTVRGTTGEAVLLAELGHFIETRIDQPIYHKNLKPVVYVFGDTRVCLRRRPILTLGSKVRQEPALAGYRVNWAGEGEWEVTLRVFRDLGVAFAVAVLGIYILLLYQTQSFLLPAIQLVSLPLSVIGIMPGFWLLNLLVGEKVGGYNNPVYFTATAMIGMIALAGIATRNAILLVEFVEERKQGRQAARSNRSSRPGPCGPGRSSSPAWPPCSAPGPSRWTRSSPGLAWSLIFGLLVSTLFTLVVVPMIYYMAYGNKVVDHQPCATVALG